ncbi:Fumarate hydratase 1 [Durusdinium trenchii]|uniref:Mitochondrial (Fumarase 1) (LmFH-1) n=1 Tax=Durusdinium trenchii TaxID=1381693 RepID=A0ABP0I4L3_9DINO
MVKRGTHVLTDGRDEELLMAYGPQCYIEFISRGVYKAYSEGYLRYSQVAPLSMFEEANTKTNLPAQIDMLSQHGNTYDVLYIAKGGGSANKTQLLQKTKGVLNDKAFTDFVTELVQGIGTEKIRKLSQDNENLKYLSQFPVATRLALTGTIIVARDIAHAKMQDMLDSGKGLPEYIKQYPVYYAGPAKTPAGMPSGSFGPTTSGRMDQQLGLSELRRGSMIMIGKGNRSKDVTKACQKHGGFYLGSIGGVAATLSAKSIKKVEVLDMEELGMEAVWKIEVEDFPAFVVVDNKGNDFFKKWSKEAAKEPEADSFFDEAKANTPCKSTTGGFV